MEKLIKEKIKKLKPSATIALNEKSKKLISEGKKIYKFGFGQSPFPVPKEIQKELSINTHRKDYLPMQGLLELRQAISSYLNKRNKFKFDFEDIIVGPGSKELMFILNQVFNGDIILPAPSWVSYAPQADIGNNKVHWIETSSETNWFPTAAQLEKKIKKIRVKKIFFVVRLYDYDWFWVFEMKTTTTYDSGMGWAGVQLFSVCAPFTLFNLKTHINIKM